MIITHTQNAEGQRRVYLGGKGSLEAWIDPRADGRSWTFHLEDAVGGQPLSDADKKAWAIHLLVELARELSVACDVLKDVPFEAIAALHCGDPLAGRRVAMPRRRTIENGFMATRPDITRPSGDFAAGYGGRRAREG